MSFKVTSAIAVAELPGLGGKARWMFGLLGSYADDDGRKIWPSIQQLVDDVGFGGGGESGLRSARRCLDQLRRGGWIRIVGRRRTPRGRMVNVYEINLARLPQPGRIRQAAHPSGDGFVRLPVTDSSAYQWQICPPTSDGSAPRSSQRIQSEDPARGTSQCPDSVGAGGLDPVRQGIDDADLAEGRDAAPGSPGQGADLDDPQLSPADLTAPSTQTLLNAAVSGVHGVVLQTALDPAPGAQNASSGLTREEIRTLAYGFYADAVDRGVKSGSVNADVARKLNARGIPNTKATGSTKGWKYTSARTLLLEKDGPVGRGRDGLVADWNAMRARQGKSEDGSARRNGDGWKALSFHLCALAAGPARLSAEVARIRHAIRGAGQMRHPPASLQKLIKFDLERCADAAGPAPDPRSSAGIDLPPWVPRKALDDACGDTYRACVAAAAAQMDRATEPITHVDAWLAAHIEREDVASLVISRRWAVTTETFQLAQRVIAERST